jgi:hypothetical protein
MNLFTGKVFGDDDDSSLTYPSDKLRRCARCNASPDPQRPWLKAHSANENTRTRTALSIAALFGETLFGNTPDLVRRAL